MLMKQKWQKITTTYVLDNCGWKSSIRLHTHLSSSRIFISSTVNERFTPVMCARQSETSKFESKTF
jgi:hypothetical protein